MIVYPQWFAWKANHYGNFKRDEYMLKNTSSSIVRGHRPVEGKTLNGSRALLCPKCSSLFINEKKCDSCGLIFGKPRTLFFNDKDNIFNLRNDFYSQSSFFGNKKLMANNEYKRRLLKRLKIICGALSEDGQRLLFQKCQDGTFLKFELGEVLKELLLHEVDYDRIQRTISDWEYQDVVRMWIKNNTDSIFQVQVTLKQVVPGQGKFFLRSIFKNIFFMPDNSHIATSTRKIITLAAATIPFILAAYFLLYFIVMNKNN